MHRLSLILPVLAAGLLACAPGEPPHDTLAVADSGRGPDSTTTARMESRARALVAFLQGTAAFPADALSDTVALYAGVEAGGRALRFGRESLRDRAAWEVPINGHRAAVTPPAASTQLSVKPGVYFRCLEYTLDARLPALAGRPHVGTKLEPPGADSCLQAWNLNFVFDTSAATPRLVAAVYDQFEW